MKSLPYAVLAASCLLFSLSQANAQTFTTPSTSPFLKLLGSSIEWADFDHDGDMDAFLTGWDYSTNHNVHNPDTTVAILYSNNGNNKFTAVTGTGIKGICNGDIAWGDMNNDGWPDLAMCGTYITSVNGDTSSTVVTKVYKNNGNSTFTSVGTFTGLGQGSVAWGDYNNDGFKDLLVTGGVSNKHPGQTFLYKNNKNNTFSAVAANLPGISVGEAHWGDYDNDGRLDILLSGGSYDKGNTSSTPYTYLYHNDGNDRFSDSGADLLALRNSSCDFGDYDNDGRLDIVLAGTESSGASYSKVYHNEGSGTFTDINAGLNPAPGAIIRWGDFTQDGLMDIIMTGDKASGIYTNNGNDQFTYSNFRFNGNEDFDLSITDVNLDGKLDFSDTGEYGAYIYTNTSTIANAAPSAPTAPQVVAFGNKALLYWTTSTDDHTASTGLNYNLSIGTNSSTCNIVSPEANSVTGAAYITGPGNVGKLNYKWLDLPSGTYYWKVQASDASFANSAYSTQGSFTLPGSSLIVHINSADSVNMCNGGSVTLTAETHPQASAYQWYKNGSPISGATNATYTASISGQYYVEAKTTGSFTKSVNTVTVNISASVAAPTAGGASGCSGTTVTLTANCGSNTCRWYTDSGTYISSGNSLKVSPTQTTNYSVVAYDPVTQCHSNEVIVTASIFPAPPKPTGNATQNFCGTGDTVLLTVDAPAPPYVTYWYTSPSGGSSIASGNTCSVYDISSPTTYYASNYDPNNGCYSPSRLAVTASVETPPAPPVTHSQFPCVSQVVTLSATPTPSSLTCKWYTTETGGASFHMDTTYTPPSPVTTPLVYFVSSYHASSGCESTQRSPITAAVRAITDAPLAQNTIVYGSTPATLFATTPPNATTCRWYSDSLQRNVLYTGNNYFSPSNMENTVTYYWVAGYNQYNQCVGAAMKKVSVTTLPVPTVQMNPDQVYPVPNDMLGEEYNGVNLFTGDVNLTLPVAEVSGAKLSYKLNVFYNSRSASITPYYTSNPLGGLGWKLLDYPKIIYDAAKTKYFFLDGLAAYPLDTLTSSGQTITLATPGEYATMTFTLSNSQTGISSGTWTIDNGKQEEFQFTNVPTSLGSTGYLWSLSSMVDAAHTDTITFSYNKETLSGISTEYGESVSLVYHDNQLTSITHATSTSNNQSQVKFVYETKQFAPQPASPILAAIETYTNINNGTYSGDWWYPSAPATAFEYAPANSTNPGALQTVTSPHGVRRTYSYLPLQIDKYDFRLVTGIATDAGHLVHYEGEDMDVLTPEAIKYEKGKPGAGGVYFQSNLTTVIPGKNLQTPLYTDANTSFEKGSKDDVFVNIDKDDLKKDYPLTGTHSLKFDGTFNLRATSKQFALTRDLRRVSNFESKLSNPVKEKGSLDSLTLSFYCLQTHQTLDVDFYLDFNFYDDKKKKIDDWGCHDKNYELQNEQYGQWVPFELRFGVPSNAQYFDFEIRGGSKLYGFDFYMDDVSISGTESNVQGELQYFFFNGQPADSLLHLPDAYVQGTEASMLKKMYYTGFESGQTFSSWFDISNGPAEVEPNTDQRESSYNGTYALSLGDNKGNKATVKATKLPIPAGADHVLLSFHYSKPQFPGMKVQFSWGCDNTSAQTQSLTLDGSYFIDPSYSYFQKIVAVNGASTFNFIVEVTDAGKKSDVNDFYIDDLTVLMLKGGNNLKPINVESPLLPGKCYLSRTFSDQYTELEVTSTVLAPTTMTNGTGYAQTKELNGTSRTAAHSGIELTYNGKGMPTTATSLWARTNPDSSVTDVWSRTHFVYAEDIYTSLPANYDDQIAVEWTEVSENYFKTWNTSAGNVMQWKTFTTGGRTIWNPWREFQLTTAASAGQIQAVVSGIASASYTPPVDQWVRIFSADSVSVHGDVIAATVNDSVPVFTQYSQRNLINGSNSHPSLPVATFVNGSPRTCLYYGFEDYEKCPAGFAGATNKSYAFTGLKSVSTYNVSFQMNFDPAGAGVSSYVMGAFILSDNQVSFSISSNGGYNATHYFPVSDTIINAWHYYEWIVTPPTSATTLTFTVKSTNGYMDDFRFSPVTADMNATVYDIFTCRPVAMVGNNADLTRLNYDRKGELHSLIGPGETPFYIRSSFYSRAGQGNNDHYNPNDPNLNSTISTPGGGAYFGMNDFARSSIWKANGNAQLSFTPLQGFTIPQNSTVTLSKAQLPINRSDWGASFSVIVQLLDAAVTPLFGLDAGGTGIAFALTNGKTLTIKNKKSGNWNTLGNLTLPSAFDEGMALDVDLVFQNGLLHLWINGQLIANSVSYTAAQFTQLSFFCQSGIAGVNSIQVNNIVLFSNATLECIFEDGLGNPIQNQFMSEAGVVITETMYDRLNRPILQTQPVAFAKTGLGFRETFITGMNWETGYLSGDVNNGRVYIEGGGDQDKGYLYWRSIYLKSPQDKIANQFLPGYDFALRSETNWEKSKQWLYKHTGEIIEYGGYVLQAAGYVLDVVDCILEPETAPFIIALDASELIVTVAQIVDEYGNKTPEKKQDSPITNYFYDREQNLSAVYLPNANKSDDPDKKQVLTYQYDFRNHLKSETSPEAGRTSYIWSSRDLLRFYATPDDLDSFRIRYIKYDRLERPIEEGFIDGSIAGDSTRLKVAANDPQYPGSSVSHRVLFTYQWDGASSGYYGLYTNRGRLTGCNVWSGGKVLSTVTYGYDVYGYTTSRRQDENLVNYTYDCTGNVKSVEYPVYSGLKLTVHYTYNKAGQIDSVFTSEETTPLATMRYYPDGTAWLTNLNFKSGKDSIPIRYYYNAPRWLTSLTAGESSFHTDTDNSHTTNYFDLELNYNVLDDAWSDLMDQVYYNGNLYSSALYPGSKATNLHKNKQGYQYDLLGHLNSYGNTYICDQLPTGGCSTLNSTFDLNGNLKDEGVWANPSTITVGWSNKRHYDDNTNRLDRIYYHYEHDVINYPDDNTYRRDTTLLKYDYSGNLVRQDYYKYTTFGKNDKHGKLDKIYTRQLTYDENDRVRSVRNSRTGGVDTLVSYAYSAEGYRIGRTYQSGSSKTTTTYVRGLNGELLWEMEAVGNTRYVRYYVYGDDGPLAMFAGNGSKFDSWFVLKDQNGSATALVNRSTKNVDANYEYDAYGLMQSDHSYNARLYSLLFTGQEFDFDTRLYNFRDRTYDPALKIFLQPDPGADNLALPYAYTGFNPVNYVDPDGAARLWAYDRRNGTNTLKNKIALERAKNITYRKGDLINFLQTKNLRNYDDKAKFIVMLESRNHQILADLDDLHRHRKKSNGGIYQKEWQKLKGWLREGKRHEMAPVNVIRKVAELGLPMEDFQKYTFLTTQTQFEEKVGNAWSGTPIAHGAVGSPAAHNELRSLIPLTNITQYQDNLALWMAGHLPNQMYRLHPNCYNLLTSTRTVVTAAATLTLRFFP